MCHILMHRFNVCNQKLRVVKPFIEHNHNRNITCLLLEALAISLAEGCYHSCIL